MDIKWVPMTVYDRTAVLSIMFNISSKQLCGCDSVIIGDVATMADSVPVLF